MAHLNFTDNPHDIHALNRRLQETAENLVALLKKAGLTVSTAESCTGGLIAKCITDVAGSSSVFYGACVTYTNAVKEELLGVPEELIERFTEVSIPCAEAMAKGVRTRLHTTFGLSTTGYAGPTGGTEADPVGTVYLAVSSDSEVLSRRFSAPDGADRREVRITAAIRVMELLSELLERTRAEKG